MLKENCTVLADKTVKRTVGTGKYILYNHLGEVAGYLDGDTDDKKNTGILEKYIIHYSARGGWYCRLDAPVQEYTFLENKMRNEFQFSKGDLFLTVDLGQGDDFAVEQIIRRGKDGTAEFISSNIIGKNLSNVEKQMRIEEYKKNWEK